MTDELKAKIAEAEESLGEYMCSVDDLPSAIRRLVSGYKERNLSAARFCEQLNSQDEIIADLKAHNDSAMAAIIEFVSAYDQEPGYTRQCYLTLALESLRMVLTSSQKPL